MSQVTLSNTGDFVRPSLFDWNTLLKNLELFYRERQVKLTQAVSGLRLSAADDEIIATMLENKETMAFADQRMTEIIKEGL